MENPKTLKDILSKVNLADIVLNIRKRNNAYVADTLDKETILINPDLYIKLTKTPLRIGNVYLRYKVFNKPSKYKS